MNEQNIITKYLLSNIIFAVPELEPDYNLIDSLLIDSISIIKVILFLEKEFGIKLDDIDLDPTNFETINQMANLVIRKGGTACQRT